MRLQIFHKSCKRTLLLGAIAAFCWGIAWAGPSEPAWMIGRAFLQSTETQKGLVLELNLRNKGATGDLPVQILARWRERGQAGEDLALVKLGNYTREVAHRKATVLILPLARLGPTPRKGSSFLEVVVMTGNRETDRQLVFLP